MRKLDRTPRGEHNMKEKSPKREEFFKGEKVNFWYN